MPIDRTAYRLGILIAIGTALFLVAGIGALGVIGAEGDRADMMFIGVLAIGICGAVISRLRAHGMARTMWVTAVATLLVGVVAIALGKHESEGTSVPEILGLTTMFAALFAASAWQFRTAAAHRDGAAASDRRPAR